MIKKNQNIIISIVIALVIILTIIIIAIFNKDKPKNLVIKMYEKINQSDNYTLFMEEANEDPKGNVSMVQRGKDACVDATLEDSHNTTLLLDNSIYYIEHNEKEYIVYEDEEADTDKLLLEELKEISKMIYASGKEKINGKEYYYEEYETDGSTFSIYADTAEDSVIKTRFYFDGDELIYIKNTVVDEVLEDEEVDEEDEEDESEETDEEEIEREPLKEELLKASLKFEVDEKLFEIPKDYAKAEM